MLHKKVHTNLFVASSRPQKQVRLLLLLGQKCSSHLSPLQRVEMYYRQRCLHDSWRTFIKIPCNKTESELRSITFVRIPKQKPFYKSIKMCSNSKHAHTYPPSLPPIFIDMMALLPSWYAIIPYLEQELSTCCQNKSSFFNAKCRLNAQRIPPCKLASKCAPSRHCDHSPLFCAALLLSEALAPPLFQGTVGGRH